VRSTFLIAGKDLRLRLRDRSAILTGVIVPFVLALVFSLILGNVDDGALSLAYGFVDEDGSQIASELGTTLESLEAGGLIEMEPVSSEAVGRSMVEHGELSAVFVVPAGFEAAIEGGRAATLLVVGDVDRQTSALIARSIADGFTAGVEGVRLAAMTAAVSGGDVAAAIDQAATSRPLVLAPIAAPDRQLDTTTFFVAGMAVFFLFFTVSIGVTSLLEEKRDGTMARLLAAPIGRLSVVGAKALVSVVLGVVSMTVLIVASTALLGAEWGAPLGVAVLVLAAVFSAVGIMAVVAAFARTPEGAQNLQAVIAVGLGMLGGVFFPAPLGDGVIARLALIAPHRWFMRGLGDLRGGDGLEVVLPAVAALVTFGLVTGGLAALRLRRGVAS
jgi:ABC-2 type transport system permease protein